MFSSADPYMKPVESSLVRHVQSSQDDSQQLEKGNIRPFIRAKISRGLNRPRLK